GAGTRRDRRHRHERRTGYLRECNRVAIRVGRAACLVSGPPTSGGRHVRDGIEDRSGGAGRRGPRGGAGDNGKRERKQAHNGSVFHGSPNLSGGRILPRGRRKGTLVWRGGVLATEGDASAVSAREGLFRAIQRTRFYNAPL